MLSAISNMYAVPFQDNNSLASRRNRLHRNREEVLTIVTEAINLVLDAESPGVREGGPPPPPPPPIPPNTPLFLPSAAFEFSTSTSEEEEEENLMEPPRRKSRRSQKTSSGYDGDNEASGLERAEEDLSLRLGIVSEVRKSQELISDWSYIGAELRQIALSFEKSMDKISGPKKDFELLGLLQNIIPSSIIPSSLWSAITSYTLWRLIKRT